MALRVFTVAAAYYVSTAAAGWSLLPFTANKCLEIAGNHVVEGRSVAALADPSVLCMFGESVVSGRHVSFFVLAERSYVSFRP